MSATLECKCLNRLAAFNSLGKRIPYRPCVRAQSSPSSIYLPWHYQLFSTSSRNSINKVLEDYLKKAKRTAKPGMNGETPTRGSLGSSSIFETDRRQSKENVEKRKGQDEKPDRADIKDMDASASAARTGVTIGPDGKVITRNRDLMGRVLNPLPMRRRRWVRRKIIKELKRGHVRYSRRELIDLTERKNVSRSHFLKTSLKKLAPLARQIVGKPIDEAIAQMRFSRKKAAREVMEHLEHAKNEAMVKHGMGLGGQQQPMENMRRLSKYKRLSLDIGPIEIETKDLKRKVIDDKTSIYIDEAWVGRGTFDREPEYRARGRINILKKPYSCIFVLLKENQTLIRESMERQRARMARKPRSLLPDRPVTAQHQYYSW